MNLADCGDSLPPQEAAIGNPENPRRFRVLPKWAVVRPHTRSRTMDGFFHGQLVAADRTRGRRNWQRSRSTTGRKPSAEAFGTTCYRRSSKHPTNQFAVHVGQAIVAALMAKREPGMVEAQQVQDCGIQVMHVDGLLSN